MPELGEAERERARAKRPDSLTAWDCYQRGLWHLYRRTRDDVAEAERLFERALKLDQGTSCRHICAARLEAHYFQGFFFQPTDDRDPSVQRRCGSQRGRWTWTTKNPAAYCALARAHLMNGDHSAAASLPKPRSPLNPTSSRARTSWAFPTLTPGVPGKAFRDLKHSDPSSAHMTNMPVGSWLQSLRRTSSWASTTRRPSGGAEPYVSRDLVTRRGGKQCTPPHLLIADAQKKRERLFKTSSGSGLNSLYASFANHCHLQTLII